MGNNGNSNHLCQVQIFPNFFSTVQATFSGTSIVSPTRPQVLWLLRWHMTTDLLSRAQHWQPSIVWLQTTLAYQWRSSSAWLITWPHLHHISSMHRQGGFHSPKVDFILYFCSAICSVNSCADNCKHLGRPWGPAMRRRHSWKAPQKRFVVFVVMFCCFWGAFKTQSDAKMISHLLHRRPAPVRPQVNNIKNGKKKKKTKTVRDDVSPKCVDNDAKKHKMLFFLSYSCYEYVAQKCLEWY